MKTSNISKRIWRALLVIIFLISMSVGNWLLLMNNLVASLASDAQANQATPDAASLGGFGILGDSGSDEYRAEDNRGGEYATTTLNWMELLVLKRGLNFGAWGNWGEPRRTGYEYNWARSGATTESLITSDQHIGLAQQVARGEVSHVLIWIGDNDFAPWNGTYREIYEGKLSSTELQDKINRVIADITTTTDTILDAGPAQVIIVTVADRGMAPQEQAVFSDPVRRQRVTEVITQVNDGIRTMAEARNIVVVDPAQVLASILAKLDKNSALNVGGVSINVTEKGNDPHHMRLDDGDGHPGTVTSGLMANAIFIEPFNNKYKLGVTPLSDKEILEAADISPSSGVTSCFGFASLITALASAFVLTRQRL
jgi:hypothetical protein